MVPLNVFAGHRGSVPMNPQSPYKKCRYTGWLPPKKEVRQPFIMLKNAKEIKSKNRKKSKQKK